MSIGHPRHYIPNIDEIRHHYIIRNTYAGFQRLWSKRLTRFALLFLIFVLILGILGPYIAPYEYNVQQRGEDGQLLRAEGPSVAHPLGTTTQGYDVLSRVIVGALPTAITGLLGGGLIITIGASIGITAGYVGGRTENLLMRFTDFAYSLPLIPFAIVLMAMFGIGFITSIIVIGLILWRGSARVLRAQVLQIKNRPFITASQSYGASTPRIMIKHVFPNVAPMAALFFAFGIGYSIIAQAGLAFLGVSNPFVPAWGVMIRNAYNSGYMGVQLGWSVTPGLLIALTVLSAFVIGREFEEEEGSSELQMAGQDD